MKTPRQAMRVLANNGEATKALKGRKIASVDLRIIKEEFGDDSVGNPVITLDDGTSMTFEVADYGCGTYGVSINHTKPRR